MLVICITQILFYLFYTKYFFSKTGYNSEAIQLQTPLFFALLLASLFIAAGGYIINDYMDQEIDRINKPLQLIIGVHIQPKKAFRLYCILSFAGLMLSLYISYKLQNYLITIFNFAACILLLVYSKTFKKTALIGNLIISALTAWVIMVLAVAEINTPQSEIWSQLFRISLIYSGFAFFLTLIREIIKDMEDVVGDAATGCRTIPLKWGMITAKYLTVALIIILSIIILSLSIYIINHRPLAGVYGIIFVALPLIYILIELSKSSEKKHYHHLSTLIKATMITGIFSILFFLI